MNIAAIIVCAGKGVRMDGCDKIKLRIAGKTLLEYSLKRFLAVKAIKQIVVVAAKNNIAFAEKIIRQSSFTKKNIIVIKGGQARQDSVRNGLAALEDTIGYVLIHDGARPFVSKALIGKIISALAVNDAVIPALPARDTLKQVDKTNRVTATVNRDSIVSVQTPQGFKKDLIVRAYQAWKKKSAFDDAQAVEAMGVKVKVVEGELKNFKITYPEDLTLAKSIVGTAHVRSLQNVHIGFGFDVHRINKPAADLRPLRLAGVKIACDFSLEAVSDGDVVLHAVADAICGAAGLGDIGDHFPPEQSSSLGIDSKDIAAFVLKKISKKYILNNIDVIIVAEKPRLVKYKDEMTRSLRKIFSLKNINVKIKSKEGLDILGGREAICSMAVVSAVKIK